MRLQRAGLLGLAISYARSKQGQQMIARARQKYDTPANRAKAKQVIANSRRGGNRAQEQPPA